MATFEVEFNGKTYEVEAPDAATAAAAFDSAPQGEYKPDLQYVDARANTRADIAGLVRPVSGVVQKATGLAEGVGVLPEGATKYVTDKANALESFIVGAKPEARTEAQKRAISTTSTIAEAAVPGVGVGKLLGPAKGVAKLAASGAAAGAAGAATVFDPEVQSAWESNLGLGAGALIGSVVSPAMSLTPAVRNRILKVFRSPPTPESMKLIRELRESPLFKSAEERLTLGQRTGDPRIEIQEARVQNRVAQNVYNRQLADAEKRIMRIVDGSPGRTPAELGEDLRQSLHTARTLRTRAASDEYGAYLDEAETLAKADVANTAGVRTSNFANALSEANVPPEKWQMLYDSAPEKHRGAVKEALDMLQKNDGRMQLGDMMKVHQALNTLRRNLSAADKAGKRLNADAASDNRLAASLQSALQKDIDHMEGLVNQAKQQFQGQPVPPGVEIPGQSYVDAWDTFKRARAAYAQRMNEEKYIEAQLLEKEFGMSPFDAEASFKKLLSADIREQQRMVSLMSPETLQDLKRWKIQEAVNKAFNASVKGATVGTKADALINQLTDGKNVSGQAIWSPSEIKDIKGAVAMLRLVQSRSTLKDPGIEPQRIVMAMISMAKPFVAGIGYRLVVNESLEKLMFTAAGRKHLQALATAPVNSPKYAAAAGWVAAQAAEASSSGGTGE